MSRSAQRELDRIRKIIDLHGEDFCNTQNDNFTSWATSLIQKIMFSNEDIVDIFEDYQLNLIDMVFAQKQKEVK